METRINVAKLLENCPKGMELDCVMYDNVEFDGFADDEFLPIRCRFRKPDGTYNVCYFTKYGCWDTSESAKCVIFPQGKTSWGGFVPPCKFKNGDILAAGDWVFIFKELHTNGSPRCYCHYDLTLEEFKVDTNSYMAYGGDIYLATKEQQDLLFSKMEGAGYKWNAETKTLDRLINPRFKVGDKVSPLCNNNQYIITELTDTHYTLVEVTKKFLYTEPIVEDKNWELVPDKFDINTLKPFDKVLARDSIIDKWHIQFFDRFDGTRSFPFFCVGNVYNQCIPYKDNEHLRGTADDCDNFYKIWED